MKKQLQVYFTGRVQGVGFRYTARRLAQGFAVTGWVKNLSDGRVEMLAEGEQAEIENFFAVVRERMKDAIQETEVIWGPAAGEFQEFEVVY